ncbi:MAG: hypothetical protein ACLTW7_15380 [Enterococcus sp.]
MNPVQHRWSENGHNHLNIEAAITTGINGVKTSQDNPKFYFLTPLT